jgi:hypothetical protein
MRQAFASKNRIADLKRRQHEQQARAGVLLRAHYDGEG